MSVREAYQLDRENGNTYWADAIELEMKEIRVAFDILDVKIDKSNQVKFTLNAI